MLPKPQRLNLNKDFKWVSSGKKLETKYIKLFIKLGSNQESKLGIAVSSRIFKKAVERNRARRLISAAFESLVVKLPGNINILALPKAGILGVKSGDLLLELEAILKYEKIIN